MNHKVNTNEVLRIYGCEVERLRDMYTNPKEISKLAYQGTVTIVHGELQAQIMPPGMKKEHRTEYNPRTKKHETNVHLVPCPVLISQLGPAPEIQIAEMHGHARIMAHDGSPDITPENNPHLHDPAYRDVLHAHQAQHHQDLWTEARRLVTEANITQEYSQDLWVTAEAQRLASKGEDQ